MPGPRNYVVCFFFVSAEYIQIVNVFEAGLGESCSDFALYLLFVWDAIVSCWTNQFDDVLASNGPALHCLWIMFFFATLVGWEHLAQQAKVRQPTSLTVNACLCGSHAQNICMLELAVRKGHRQLQKIQWIRRTRTIQRWIIDDNRRWSVKHFEMHSYSWSLVLGQLSQVSWSGRWTWVWVMLPAAELQGPAVKTRKEKLPSLSYIILYLWSLDWNGFCTCISDEFGWFKSFLHVFTLRCFTLFLQLIWFRWVRGPFFFNGA